MAIVERVMYQAVCDGCGARHGEGDEIVAWSDASSALEVAEGADWRKQDDGRLLCFDCRALPGGDHWEEPDVLP